MPDVDPLKRSNYGYDRGPDPLELREVESGSDGGLYGHNISEDSEVQDVVDTIEDASKKGHSLRDSGDGIISSLTKQGRRTQTSMRQRQRDRQTGFSMSDPKTLVLLAGAGALVGGYIWKGE